MIVPKRDKNTCPYNFVKLIDMEFSYISHDEQSVMNFNILTSIQSFKGFICCNV